MGTVVPGIDVLNTGHGHAEINFNADDPIESRHGQHIIEDMLRRGYDLFITGDDGKVTRVTEFCAKTGRYIIGDRTGIPQAEPIDDEPEPAAAAEGEVVASPPEKRGRGRPPKYGVPMNSVRPTAVGKSAGG